MIKSKTLNQFPARKRLSENCFQKPPIFDPMSSNPSSVIPRAKSTPDGRAYPSTIALTILELMIVSSTGDVNILWYWRSVSLVYKPPLAMDSKGSN